MNAELAQRWTKLWMRFGFVVMAVFAVAVAVRAVYHLYIPLHGPFDIAARAYPEHFPDATYEEIGLCFTCGTRRISNGDSTRYRFTIVILEAGKEPRLVQADVVDGKGADSVSFRERR